jgi:penicillin amidase
VINATKTSHGPSWRMIVHLSDVTEAFGVYPGGQSGNPGSQYYNSFVNNWVNGQYYKLFFMKQSENGDDRIKWVINCSPAA